MNKEETVFKIRTDKQLERLNYLLCFKSKSAIAEMLIDTEERITRAIEYIGNKNIGVPRKTREKAIKILKGGVDDE